MKQLEDIEKKPANSTLQQKCNIRKLISEILSYDPRPAYKASKTQKIYGIRLFNLNILWKVKQTELQDAAEIEVMEVTELQTE